MKLLMIVGATWFCLLSLPVIFAHGQAQKTRDEAGAQKEPSPAEIAKLIKELTHHDEKVAESAHNALVKTGLGAIDSLLLAFHKGEEKTRGEVSVVLGSIRKKAVQEKKDEVASAIEEVLLEGLRDPSDYVFERVRGSLTRDGALSKRAMPIFIEFFGLRAFLGRSRGALFVDSKLVSQKEVRKVSFADMLVPVSHASLGAQPVDAGTNKMGYPFKGVACALQRRKRRGEP